MTLPNLQLAVKETEGRSAKELAGYRAGAVTNGDPPVVFDTRPAVPPMLIPFQVEGLSGPVHAEAIDGTLELSPRVRVWSDLRAYNRCRGQGHVAVAGVAGETLIWKWLDDASVWQPLGLEDDGVTTGPRMVVSTSGDLRGAWCRLSAAVLAKTDVLIGLFNLAAPASPPTPLLLGNLFLRTELAGAVPPTGGPIAFLNALQFVDSDSFLNLGNAAAVQNLTEMTALFLIHTDDDTSRYTGALLSKGAGGYGNGWQIDIEPDNGYTYIELNNRRSTQDDYIDWDEDPGDSANNLYDLYGTYKWIAVHLSRTTPYRDLLHGPIGGPTVALPASYSNSGNAGTYVSDVPYDLAIGKRPGVGENQYTGMFFMRVAFMAMWPSNKSKTNIDAFIAAPDTALLADAIDYIVPDTADAASANGVFTDVRSGSVTLVVGPDRSTYRQAVITGRPLPQMIYGEAVPTVTVEIRDQTNTLDTSYNGSVSLKQIGNDTAQSVTAVAGVAVFAGWDYDGNLGTGAYPIRVAAYGQQILATTTAGPGSNALAQVGDGTLYRRTIIPSSVSSGGIIFNWQFDTVTGTYFQVSVASGNIRIYGTGTDDNAPAYTVVMTILTAGVTFYGNGLQTIVLAYSPGTGIFSTEPAAGFGLPSATDFNSPTASPMAIDFTISYRSAATLVYAVYDSPTYPGGYP